jgi:hypothetical protein
MADALLQNAKISKREGDVQAFHPLTSPSWFWFRQNFSAITLSIGKTTKLRHVKAPQ